MEAGEIIFREHIQRMISTHNLRRFFVVVFIMFTCVSFFFAHAHSANASTENKPYSRSELLAQINRVRLQNDLDKLKLNAELNRAAQNKVNDMVRNGYFGHEAPTGLRFFDFIKASGYTYRKAGENLAVNYATSKTLISAWLKSQGHRANVLSEAYTDTGIGIAYGTYSGQKGWFVVEMFGTEL